MRKTGLIVLILLVLGCGKEKSGETSPSQPGDSKGNSGETLGDPKFKLAVPELIDAFKKNPSDAARKYGGHVIELEGSVQSVYRTSSKNPSGSQTLVKVMPVGTVRGLSSVDVATNTWTCNIPGPDVTPRLILTQRVRIKGYLPVGDPRNWLQNLTRCEIAEFGKDDSLRVSASEISKAASENVEVAYEKYSERAVVLTGVIKGKAKDVGGAECVELVTDGEVRVLGSPCTFLADELQNPRIGEKVTWTGILRGSFNNKDPYVLWEYWPVKDEKR